MPYASRRQARWAHATGQSFAKRWDKLTDFDALPEKKDSGVSGMAIPPTGSNALFNQPGIGTLAKRRKKIKLKACDCGCSSVEKALSSDAAPAAKPKPKPTAPAAAKPAAGKGQPGELLEPGVRRIRGNLCNVHGRYGPCDGGGGAKKPKKPGKGRAGAKPKKPQKTDEERSAERDQKRQANADAVAQRMADSDTGLSPSGVQAMRDLASGKQPAGALGDNLVEMGLADRGADGSVRMSATGRAAMNAMAAGDYQRTVDTIARAGDTASARRGRQETATARQTETATRRAAAEAKRQAAQAKREAAAAAKKPGKAGAGGEKKPEKAPGKLAQRRAGRAGASGVGGGGGAGGSFSATPGKKPEAPEEPKEPEKAKPQIAPALIEAAEAMSAGAEMTMDQLRALIRNGLARIDRDGMPVLTAAGLNATKKDDRPRSYLMRRKEQITIKHGAHDQSSHGRKRGGGGGGAASARGVTSKVLPEGHPILQRFGHNTENYREFDDPMRADAAMTSMYQGWANSLTDEEKNAVRGYQQQTFGLVNDTLRGHRPDDDKTPFARQESQKLDTALDSADVPYNVTTYRGMVNPGLSVGAEFTDLGYGSTTLAPAIARARAQAHGDQGVVARIKVPQGAKGAYVETVTPIDQAELLLHRGTRYRVIGTGDGVIDLEVVN